MVKAQTLKGFRDFLPKEAKKRQYVVDTLRKAFESYGFEPLETPALEYQEVLSGKYGDEGDRLMYKFTDQGGRDIALKYDQTVPLARVIAQYLNELVFPFKRFQIQNAWRAENPQKGRYREFIQCDIDTVGIDSAFSDFELCEIALEGYRKLGFKNVKILINDRSAFGDIPNAALLTIDKLNKVGEEKVRQELEEKGFGEETLDKVKKLEPTKRIQEILEFAKKAGLENEITFEPTLARGLDYYTGIIMEAQSNEYQNGSLGGGGRYNNLISLFINKQISAAGFSFGFDRTIDAMEDLDLFPKDMQTTKVLLTYSAERSLSIAKSLRNANINTEIFSEEKDLEKQLKYADKKTIPYVIIFENNKLLLKDMKNRTQEELPLEEIIKKLA
jgi:histidyl-tRNA synthetase